jgi:curved DNA-binding protein CbpA
MCCEFTTDTTSIKRAYRKKALILHPDKGGDAEQFKKLGNSLNKIITAIGTYLQIFPQMA